MNPGTWYSMANAETNAAVKTTPIGPNSTAASRNNARIATKMVTVAPTSAAVESGFPPLKAADSVLTKKSMGTTTGYQSLMRESTPALNQPSIEPVWGPLPDARTSNGLS